MFGNSKRLQPPDRKMLSGHMMIDQAIEQQIIEWKCAPQGQSAWGSPEPTGPRQGHRRRVDSIAPRRLTATAWGILRGRAGAGGKGRAMRQKWAVGGDKERSENAPMAGWSRACPKLGVKNPKFTGGNCRFCGAQKQMRGMDPGECWRGFNLQPPPIGRQTLKKGMWDSRRDSSEKVFKISTENLSH